MTLWTSNDAARATGGSPTQDWQATGVSIDTRSLQPGDLFVALKAARDGHDFVADALTKGAAAALVTHVPDGVAADAPLLLVDDVQSALEALGQAARARTKARVVAITGSVGKTSTKEMLAAMLGGQGKTHASVASYNNHWGVPLTLARMPRDTDFAVIEIGMNHPGEIAPLSQMAKPHVALVTTVAAAHLEAFDSVDGIAREKGSICKGLLPDGQAVLNGDIPTFPILKAAADAAGATTISFGAAEDCDMRLTEVSIVDDTVVARAETGGHPILFKVAAPARHFASNAIGALAAATALGADPALSIHALGRWTPYAGRGAHETILLDLLEPDQRLHLIDDAYNANPASLAAALTVLSERPVQNGKGRIARGRRIAYLGDMKELGPEAAAFHARIAELPALDQIDRIHCIGPLMCHLHAALPEDKRGRWTETSAEMVPFVRASLDAGDVVMAKGSLAMKLAQIVDAIRKMGHGADGDQDTT